MSRLEKLAAVGIAVCILAWFIASSPAQADESSVVLENLIEKRGIELFNLANEKYQANEDLEAAIYLASLISLYRNVQEEDEITRAFEESLDAIVYKIETLEDDFRKAKELCGSGCDEDTATVAFISASFLRFPRDPLPNSFEDQSIGRLFCRGGGEMSFALESQRTNATIWVDFEAGAQRGQEDHENVYRLEPGQCTLLARVIGSNEQTWLNLQPLLEQQDTFSINWDVSGVVRGIGSGSVNRGMSFDPSAGVFGTPGDAIASGEEHSFDALEVEGEPSTPIVSVWQAIDDLESSERYVEFEVATGADKSFVATSIVQDGPWSKYERIEVEFQNGLSPTSDYFSATDSTISQHSSDDRFGDQGTCFIDGDDPPGSNHDLATLLFWDIRAIPAGSTIKSASITLNVVDASESQYQVFALNRVWSEEQGVK